jgi:YVTN family beta-propeller protein
MAKKLIAHLATLMMTVLVLLGSSIVTATSPLQPAYADELTFKKIRNLSDNAGISFRPNFNEQIQEFDQSKNNDNNDNTNQLVTSENRRQCTRSGSSLQVLPNQFYVFTALDLAQADDKTKKFDLNGDGIPEAKAITHVDFDTNILRNSRTNRITCIKVSFTVFSELPFWANIGIEPTNKCAEVVEEWNRVDTQIKSHEEVHRNSIITSIQDGVLKRVHTQILGKIMTDSDVKDLIEGIIKGILDRDHARIGHEVTINTNIKCEVCEITPKNQHLGDFSTTNTEQICVGNGRMYVSHRIANASISVIDTSTNQVINRIPVDDFPWRMAFDSIHEKLYVIHVGSDKISIINTTTNQIIGKLFLGDEIESHTDIIFDLSNKKILLNSDQNIYIIDTNIDTIKNIVNVGFGLGPMLFDPVHERLYFINRLDHTISILDTKTDQIINTISVNLGPSELALDSIHNKLYVSHSTSGFDSISVIDVSAMQIVNTIPIGNEIGNMIIDLNHSKLYTTNISILPSPILIIDTKTDQIINIMIINEESVRFPTADTFAFDSDHSKLYVLVGSTSIVEPSALVVIDTNTDTIINTIKNLRALTGFSFDPVKEKLYVVEDLDNAIAIINSTTGTLDGHVSVGFRPEKILFVP